MALMKNKQIGKILIEKGKISSENLQEALLLQRVQQLHQEQMEVAEAGWPPLMAMLDPPAAIIEPLTMEAPPLTKTWNVCQELGSASARVASTERVVFMPPARATT